MQHCGVRSLSGKWRFSPASHCCWFRRVNFVRARFENDRELSREHLGKNLPFVSGFGFFYDDEPMSAVVDGRHDLFVPRWKHR